MRIAWLYEIVLHSCGRRDIALGDSRMIVSAFLCTNSILVDMTKISDCVEVSLLCCLFIVLNSVPNFFAPSRIALLKQFRWVHCPFLEKTSYFVETFWIFDRGRLYKILTGFVEVACNVTTLLIKTAKDVADEGIYSKLCLRLALLACLRLTNFWNALIYFDCLSHVLGATETHEHLVGLP